MSPDSSLTTTDPQLLTGHDLYLFNEGSHYRIYDTMGAHLADHNGQSGAIFSVWAPNACSVSVVGSFNGWDPKTHKLSSRGSSGIWEGFIPTKPVWILARARPRVRALMRSFVRVPERVCVRGSGLSCYEHEIPHR